MNVQFGIVKTTAGYYVWRFKRGSTTVYQSREFLSAKAATASADQMIVLAMLMARSRSQIEIHNLSGEEI